MVHQFRRFHNIAILLMVFLLAGMCSACTKRQVVPPQEKPWVHALVVPHHDLILHLFSSFYDEVPVSQSSQISTVVLLSPNHTETENPSVIVPEQSFHLLDGKEIQIDTGIEHIRRLDGVHSDDTVFVKEHGVQFHLPFIKSRFPNARVLPMLLTRRVPLTVIDAVMERIEKNLDPKTTLFLVSTDFSHNLPYADAEKRDEEILKLLQSGNKEQIRTLPDAYVDCPSCLYVLMGIMQQQGYTPEVFYHGNSAQYMSLPSDSPTTSYYGIEWK